MIASKTRRLYCKPNSDYMHHIITILEFLSWEFPGELVVRIRRFHCRGPGSIAGGGTEILQAVQCGQKKKNSSCLPPLLYL